LQSIAGAFRHSFWWSFGTCVLAIAPALFLPNTGVAKRMSPAGILELSTE
jgi:hypothetical protein